MNACTHPTAFFAIADGCRVREATHTEVLAWVAGQRHPRFSLAAPRFLCFEGNVRVGDVVIARETVCYCRTNQPYLD